MTDRPELIVLYRDIFVRTPSGWRIQKHQAEHLFKSPAYSTPAVPDSMR
jgi:hypothetical protein